MNVSANKEATVMEDPALMAIVMMFCVLKIKLASQPQHSTVNVKTDFYSHKELVWISMNAQLRMSAILMLSVRIPWEVINVPAR